MVKKVFTILLVGCILSGFLSAPSAADNSQSANIKSEETTNVRNAYSSYLNQFKAVSTDNQEIVIPADSFSAIDGDGIKKENEYQGKKNVITWTGSDSSAFWEIDVPEDALYNISMNYLPLKSKNMKIHFEISIDDSLPFESADNLIFNIPWSLNKDFQQDSRGNDILPDQQKILAWTETVLQDSDGVYNDPYLFYFSKGKHKIGIKANSSDFVLSSFKLFNIKEPVTYKSYAKSTAGKTNEAKNENIIIDAEKPSMKSDSIIMPLYERSSAATVPTSATSMLLNTIGGDKWKSAGQWIQWDFTVKKSGYYKIGIKARQNLKNGLSVNRKIYIDDKVLFDESKNVIFKFSSGWHLKVLGDNSPFLFYIKAGKHTIKIETVPGTYGEISETVLNDIYDLNNIYREILLITGTSPDAYRDYNLFEGIPDLKENLISVKGKLKSALDKLLKLGKSGSETAIINELIVQIESFIQNPDSIPKRLDSFHTKISAISAWALSLKEQPLEMDYIQLIGNNQSFNKINVSIFETIKFNFGLVLGSFFSDYSTIGDYSTSKKSINVWVSAGKDQAQTIKKLVDEYYSSQYKTSVNISLVQTGLIEATISGKGPDVALFVGASDPVNLASRGALVDLSKRKGYQDVAKRFSSSAMVPFTYNEGVYALPITQNFPMMFYRKDIFNQLGISPPKTWNEFYDILPFIQGKNMNVGIPDIFSTLLFQNGGSFYSDDLSKTALDTEAATSAFSQWTEYYTMYGLPLTFDFFNRFRTGEMPLGIAPYTLYNQLYVAAPEIKNMWDMVPVPGTLSEDGKINSTVGGTGEEAAIILNSAKDKQSAWEFVLWFTSANIQASYANNIEAILGEIARFPTANREAFNQLPWNTKQRNQLNAQWDSVMESPQIPAAYYVGRNITNAFRKVTYNYENPRHTLHLYNNYMNKEIARKNTEMGKYNQKNK